MNLEKPFIFAEPKTQWIQDIIFGVLSKLPAELFCESRTWGTIITQFPFIHEFNVADAKETVYNITNERTVSKDPIFPLDASESESNLKQYIERKSLRIMIIGFENSLEIAELLAAKFGAIHITPNELVERHIVGNTQIGKWLNLIIKKGMGIPTWVVLKLLESEIEMDKYLHQGFILSGFPIIPDISTQLNIPCEFPGDDHYYDNIESHTEKVLTDEDVESSLRNSTLAMCSNSEKRNRDILNAIRNMEYVYADSNEDTVLRKCVHTQLNFIYNLLYRPDYIIYLDTQNFTKQFTAIIKILQNFVLLYNKENVIKTDCRIGIEEMFRSICNRFMYANYKVKYDCVLVNTSKNGTKNLKELCEIDTITPNCKWWVSQFGRICPVNLYQGRLRFCDSKFPVRYLKYMFLCYSKDDRKTFMVNPGKYMNLMPACRVAVVGPHRSGKTTLSQFIARYLKANLYISHIEQVELDKTTDIDESVKQMVGDLETQLLCHKQTKITEWSLCVLDVINEIFSVALNKELQNQPREDIFTRIHAEKCFQGDSTLDNRTKLLALEHALFNKNMNNFKFKHFLNWTSNTESDRAHRQFVLDSAPIDANFWENLGKNDKMPDCVFFLKISSVEKMQDLYSLVHDKKCINNELIFEKIVNTFSEWREHFERNVHAIPQTYSRLKTNRPYHCNTNFIESRFKDAVEFMKGYDQLKSYLQKHNVVCIEIDIAKQSWTQSILKAMVGYLSLYQTMPTSLYKQEYDDSIKKVNEEITNDISTNFGNCLNWCPILLNKCKVLLKGNMSYSAEFKNKVYAMHSKRALSEFLSEPRKFIHKISEMPPPRVYIAGLNHSNKLVFARSLASSLGVEDISYMQNLTNMEYNSFFRDDFSINYVMDHYGENKTQFLKDFAVTFKNGAVVFGFPMLMEQFNDVIAQNMYPECVFILDDQDEILQALYRHYAKLHVTQCNTSSSYEEKSSSIHTEIESLPEIVKHEIREKFHIFIQPFLIESQLIEAACLKLQIPVIKVDKNYKRASIVKQCVDKINSGRTRFAMFENVQVISMEQSDIFLESGYYRYSRFKRSCPVDVYRLVTLNHFVGMQKQGCIYPCIYRDFIYFLRGNQNLKDFKKNPLEFVNTCNPPQMSDPMRIAIYGPSKSGVTSICQTLSKEIGFKILSLKDLPRVTDTTVIDWLNMNSSTTPNGLLLDNIPLTPDLLINAARGGVDITAVFIIKPSFKKILQNWYEQNQRKKNNPGLELANIFQSFCITMQAIRSLQKATATSLFNIHYMDGDANSWTTYEKVKHEIIQTTRCILGYKIKLQKNRCASLAYLNLFYDTVVFKREINHFYCPVCLSLGKLNAFKYFYINVGEDFYSDECQKLLNEPYGYLNNEIYTRFNFNMPFEASEVIEPLATQKKYFMRMLQYRDVYFWTCGDHTIDFLLNTLQYFSEAKKVKTPHIPFLVIGYTKEFVAYNGFCPIAFYEGQLVKGLMNMSVYYRKKVYLMSNKENCIEFMSFPEKYSKLQFDEYVVLPTKNLNTFCSLSEERITSTLYELVNIRPKYFGLDGKQSATTFCALELKSKSCSLKYKDYWNIVQRCFVKDCILLDEELKKHRKTINPFILS